MIPSLLKNLQLLTLILSLCLLFSRKKESSIPGDDESCKHNTQLFFIIVHYVCAVECLRYFSVVLQSILLVFRATSPTPDHRATVASGRTQRTTPQSHYGALYS